MISPRTERSATPSIAHVFCALSLIAVAGCQKISPSKVIPTSSLPFASTEQTKATTIQTESNNEVSNSTSTHSSATRQEFAKPGIGDVRQWSSAISKEIAHHTLAYRCQRIEKQILPELDRMQADLKTRLLTLHHEEYLRQQSVIELVRRQWTKELQLLREQLGEVDR